MLTEAVDLLGVRTGTWGQESGSTQKTACPCPLRGGRPEQLPGRSTHQELSRSHLCYCTKPGTLGSMYEYHPWLKMPKLCHGNLPRVMSLQGEDGGLNPGPSDSEPGYLAPVQPVALCRRRLPQNVSQSVPGTLGVLHPQVQSILD